MKDIQRHNKNGPGLTRRQFLKGSGAAAAATALGPGGALPALADADKGEGDVVAVGPGPARLELTVNGKKMTTSAEPRVTLLDALRNYLDVTGCKRVCDRGTCGACTVLLDGKPVYSCSMLALEARGKDVTYNGDDKATGLDQPASVIKLFLEEETKSADKDNKTKKSRTLTVQLGKQEGGKLFVRVEGSPVRRYQEGETVYLRVDPHQLHLWALDGTQGRVEAWSATV